MIEGKRVLAVIPARGGSKGLPRKNVTALMGKPLLTWTVEEAKKSKYIDRLILSSENEEIIRLAKSLGCEVPFVRPDELSRDETPGIEPILHALTLLPGYDLVMMLQPTSPLRSVMDIDGGVEQCLRKNANACVSVTETQKSPYWMYSLDSDERMKPVLEIEEKTALRRQDLPRTYFLNGAVYVAHKEWLIQTRSFVSNGTVGYVMPRERSVDIDTEFDFKIAEFLLGERQGCNTRI